MAISTDIFAHVPATILPLNPLLNSNRSNCKNGTKNAEKPPKKAVFLPKVVGVRGLEPRASCSQSRRATNCATPRYEVVGLPGGFSQSKRATNCATPGYEVFQLWSNMGSTPVFDHFPARGRTPSALASQSFPGGWGNAVRTPASRSQITCATNCATPSYGTF